MRGKSQSAKVSNLSFAEMCGYAMQLTARTEIIWQRVVYIHAAMIGVMVFFSEAQSTYTLARLLVFAFYTVNMLIAYLNMREIYKDLDTVQRDLKRFPDCDLGGELQTLLVRRNYANRSAMRAAILTVAWLLVGVLLFLDPSWN